MSSQFPPILSAEQFGKLVGASESTVYFWISEGKFDGATTLFGNHRRLWRDRAVEIFFNKGKPKDQDQEVSNDEDLTNDNNN